MALNDILTLGLILVLLFGSISLYLYTRIQQAEQKINLIESIMLDLKMSSEIKDYPDLPAPVPRQGVVSYNAVSEESSDHTDNHTDEVEQYKSAIEEGLQNNDSSPTLASNEHLMMEHTFTAAPSSPAPSASSHIDNYESMTLKELKELAKDRNIVVTGMKRGQIIDALKTSDRSSSNKGSIVTEEMLFQESPFQSLSEQDAE
jgi:hypothetical protein